MPAFKNRNVLEVGRGIKVFWNLEAGVTRSQTGEVKTLHRQDEKRPAEHKQRPSGEVDPSKMVWIFGSGRSGSTWLRSMMAEMKGHAVWEEPMVGELFGGFYKKAQKGHKVSANYIMGDPTREGWLRSIRRFVVDGAGYAKPGLATNSWLVIKEPNGSAGAPLLMDALPESRMILLVRDPRDVVASVLDATKQGSWMFERKSSGGWKENALADRQPNVMTQRRANKYVAHVGKALQAYEAHRGPKVLVKYEDLVSDTLGTMRRIYSELDIPTEGEELPRTVEKHSWENIPAEEKGAGKFYRKGSPGSWREDLTEEQVRIVEDIAAKFLNAFYSAE